MRDNHKVPRSHNGQPPANRTKSGREGRRKLLNALPNEETLARRRFNSLLPIHRLPPETLVSLFEILVWESTFADHYRLTYTLARVCSSWKILIESTPSMWTRVSSRYTELHVKNILERSDTCPLLVEFARGPHRDEEVSYKVAGLWLQEMLLPHAHRWSFLRLDLIPGHDDSFITLAMPLAVSLRYLCIGWGVASSQLQPPQHTALTGVHIYRHSIGPISSTLTGLKYLKLSALSERHWNHSGLQSLLTQNPELRHLALHNLDSPLNNIPKGSVPILLLHLESLSIKQEGRGFPLFYWITETLNTPSLRDPEYVITNWRGKRRNALQMIADMLLKAKKGPNFLSVPELTLELAPRKKVWDCSGLSVANFKAGDSSAVRLDWRPMIPLDIINACLDESLSHRVQTCRISLEITTETQQTAFTEARFKELPPLFPNLVSYIDHRNIFTTTALFCVSLTNDVNNAIPWPFPLLQELHLPLTNKGKHVLLAMVEKRYGGPPIMETPAALQQLNIGMHGTTFDPVVDELVSILGQGVVTVNGTVKHLPSTYQGQWNGDHWWFDL